MNKLILFILSFATGVTTTLLGVAIWFRFVPEIWSLVFIPVSLLTIIWVMVAIGVE